MKILIADDIMSNRLLASRMLEKRGHLVKSVDNAMAAIEQLSNEDFDLVLMDVHMPVMSGIEAAKIIRSTNSPVRCHQVPILAVSAGCEGDCEDKRECIRAGMNGYVSKPFRSNEFIAMVEQYDPKPEDTRAS